MLDDSNQTSSEGTLLDAFRLHYRRIESGVTEATSSTSSSGSDLVVVERLGDDIDEYTSLFNQVFIILSFSSNIQA